MPLERLEAIVGNDRMESLLGAARTVRESMAGHTLWNVNSTASGGGVAEMLRVLVGYATGAGVSVRWTVIEADERFFVITKRIHHWLHGANGDGAPLGESDVAHYNRVIENNGQLLRRRMRPGDIVVLHDPQTAGLIPILVTFGATVVWRCHIGAVAANDNTHQAWSFLRPYLDLAEAFVFSRAEYARGGCLQPRFGSFLPRSTLFPRRTKSSTTPTSEPS